MSILVSQYYQIPQYTHRTNHLRQRTSDWRLRGVLQLHGSHSPGVDAASPQLVAMSVSSSDGCVMGVVCTTRSMVAAAVAPAAADCRPVDREARACVAEGVTPAA